MGLGKLHVGHFARRGREALHGGFAFVLSNILPHFTGPSKG